MRWLRTLISPFYRTWIRGNRRSRWNKVWRWQSQTLRGGTYRPSNPDSSEFHFWKIETTLTTPLDICRSQRGLAVSLSAPFTLQCSSRHKQMWSSSNYRRGSWRIFELEISVIFIHLMIELKVPVWEENRETFLADQEFTHERNEALRQHLRDIGCQEAETAAHYNLRDEGLNHYSGEQERVIVVDGEVIISPLAYVYRCENYECGPKHPIYEHEPLVDILWRDTLRNMVDELRREQEEREEAAALIAETTGAVA